MKIWRVNIINFFFSKYFNLLIEINNLSIIRIFWKMLFNNAPIYNCKNIIILQIIWKKNMNIFNVLFMNLNYKWNFLLFILKFYFILFFKNYKYSTNYNTINWFLKFICQIINGTTTILPYLNQILWFA